MTQDAPFFSVTSDGGNFGRLTWSNGNADFWGSLTWGEVWPKTDETIVRGVIRAAVEWLQSNGMNEDHPANIAARDQLFDQLEEEGIAGLEKNGFDLSLFIPGAPVIFPGPVFVYPTQLIEDYISSMRCDNKTFAAEYLCDFVGPSEVPAGTPLYFRGGSPSASKDEQPIDMPVFIHLDSEVSN